jgi:hypothetical protein
MCFFGKVRLEKIRFDVICCTDMSFLSLISPSLAIYVKLLQFFVFYDSTLCFQDLGEIVRQHTGIGVIT